MMGDRACITRLRALHSYCCAAKLPARRSRRGARSARACCTLRARGTRYLCTLLLPHCRVRGAIHRACHIYISYIRILPSTHAAYRVCAHGRLRHRASISFASCAASPASPRWLFARTFLTCARTSTCHKLRTGVYHIARAAAHTSHISTSSRYAVTPAATYTIASSSRAHETTRMHKNGNNNNNNK